MAKKKKKGAGAKDVDDLSKSALKAYHKEICAFYLDNGWRETLSYFSLSPKQASDIIPKKFRTKRKELEKENKKKAPKKKKGAKKLGKKKAEKAPKKPKAAKPAKPAKKKAGKRKPGRPRKTAVGEKVVAQEPQSLETSLDFLISYRESHGTRTIDDAIIYLATQIRAAA